MRRTGGVTAVAASLALLATGCLGSKSSDNNANRNADAKDVTLSIAANAAPGGKNAQEADWVNNWVIPRFTAAEKAKGVTAHVTFQPSGVGDEDYKSKLALDLRSQSGADVISLDGIWVGEFADAGYIKPLEEVAGARVNDWDGWPQIPSSVQQLMSYNGKRYGIPAGTDGRVLFFNKRLFAQAGLPVSWQPHSWADIIAAGQKLKALPGVTPIQLNAGTAMGEATSMQGVLPLLVGTGRQIYSDGRWQGNSAAVRDVLDFYRQVYGSGLGDKTLQQEAKGRDKSFALFAKNKIGILLESDYFWRGVVEPKQGINPMPDRDQNVGYALIPAKAPGTGINGQDYVSMSGGGGRVVNPNSKYPQQAWDLLTFMNSAEAVKAFLNGNAKITQRTDVNGEVLKNDPMLTFVATRVLPFTAFRPALAAYPQVSQALQQATLDVVTGKSPADAAAAYGTAVAKAVGGAGNVSSG
ncbi:MAG TPA: extracellular solute-binding protein [Mycobacteriales bacterium]|nr:extracellular solute-binding protein [Mycobacteriales bacterium]